MSAVTPFLMFPARGAEAVRLYVSLFPNSRILSIAEHADAEGRAVLDHATFELDGRPYHAMDGGPHFTFAEGLSLYAHCETQEEIDRLWAALTADGGEEQPCGWLRDRFGVSWQVIPGVFGELLQRGDPERAARMMQAAVRMRKLDSAALRAAYEG